MKSTSSMTPASPVGRSRWHLLLAVPLALLMVLGAPYLATAAFTATTSATLTVGTYKIPAPTAVTTGTRTCTNNQGVKGASIPVTSWSAVDRATGYVVTLTSPSGGQSQTAIRGGSSSAVTASVQDVNGNGNGSGSGTYTLSIRATIGSWVGDPIIRTFTC